jgi:NIPSNAP
VILEVRTYTAYPGEAAQRLDYSEKRGLPVRLKHLGGLVGFFTREIVTLNQIVHMWRYESLSDREVRHAAMAKVPLGMISSRTGPSPRR